MARIVRSDWHSATITQADLPRMAGPGPSFLRGLLIGLVMACPFWGVIAWLLIRAVF